MRLSATNPTITSLSLPFSLQYDKSLSNVELLCKLLIFTYCSFQLKMREKGKDLTQTYDKTPTQTEQFKKQRDNTKIATKMSITQRLQTDLGRSVGITTVTQLVWLTSLRDPNLHTHLKSVTICLNFSTC